MERDVWFVTRVTQSLTNSLVPELSGRELFHSVSESFYKYSM